MYLLGKLEDIVIISANLCFISLTPGTNNVRTYVGTNLQGA